MADARDTDATRVTRGDAALVAQYIHELSERHGPAAAAASGDALGGESRGDGAESERRG